MLEQARVGPEEEQAIARALDPIEAVRVAWLFGSRVHGRPHPGSDLDLAVAYDPAVRGRARELARRDVVAAVTDALGPVGERLDVVDVDRSDSGVALQAIRQGHLVLARTDAERADAIVRILRRHDDDLPRRRMLRRAAIEAGRRLGAEVRR
ncbi:MAG: nucleotidyltransferase domain-containing protein [Myxococcota bacterium]